MVAVYVTVRARSSRSTRIYIAVLAGGAPVSIFPAYIHGGVDVEMNYAVAPPLALAILSPDLLRRLGAPQGVIDMVSGEHVPETLEASLYACQETRRVGHAYGRVFVPPVCGEELYLALALAGATGGGGSPRVLR